MDLSVTTITQTNPTNRLVFNQKAFDQSANRTAQRKAKVRALWTRCCIQFGVATDDLRMITKIASAQRAS